MPPAQRSTPYRRTTHTRRVNTRTPTAMSRASHSPQRHHPRQLRGLLARRPPDTTTQKPRNDHHGPHRGATTPRTRTPTTDTAKAECITNNATSAAHRNNKRPQHSSTRTHTERAHAPPPHDTTPQRTRALTAVGAAAGAGVVAGAGTVGAGCITSHDSIIIGDTHITPQGHPRQEQWAQTASSHGRINEHRR